MEHFLWGNLIAHHNFSSISRSMIAIRSAYFKANAALSWEDWDFILDLEIFAKISCCRLCFLAVSSNVVAPLPTIWLHTFLPTYILTGLWWKNCQTQPAFGAKFGASQRPWDSLQSPWCCGCLAFTSSSLAAENNCALTNKSVFTFQTFISDSLGLQVCLGESNSTSAFQLWRNTLVWAGGEPDPQITVSHHSNPVLPWISTHGFSTKSSRTFCKAQSYLCSHLS